MYKQVEKPKENKNRAIANTVTQKKSSDQHAFGFVDNRPEAIAQRKLRGMIDNSVQLKGVIQRKYDHLFNDIPKTLNSLDSKLKNPLVTTKIQELTTIRDKDGNGKQDFAVGEDQNSKDYGKANRDFHDLMKYYADPTVTVLPQEVRIATDKLWRNSIDEPLAINLWAKVTGDVASWKAKEKPVYEALIKFRTHTSALKNQ